LSSSPDRLQSSPIDSLNKSNQLSLDGVSAPVTPCNGVLTKVTLPFPSLDENLVILLCHLNGTFTSLPCLSLPSTENTGDLPWLFPTAQFSLCRYQEVSLHLFLAHDVSHHRRLGNGSNEPLAYAPTSYGTAFAMFSMLPSNPPRSSALWRHPSTRTQTHSNSKASGTDAQRPLPVPSLEGLHSPLALSDCTLLYFSRLYLQVLWAGPLTNSLSLAFLPHPATGVWEELSTRCNAANKQVQLEYGYTAGVSGATWKQRQITFRNYIPPTIHCKKNIFFQVSSFSGLCNNFSAIQLCVYEKTCLLSTWQKPAAVALQKHKWEDGYFLGEKDSPIQDWKRDGKRLKHAWIPSAGQFSLQCTRLFEMDTGDGHTNKSWGPGHEQKPAKRPREEAADGETPRKGECANKVTSGDATCARRSLLPPLAPWQEDWAERRAARTKSWRRGSTASAGWGQRPRNGTSKQGCR